MTITVLTLARKTDLSLIAVTLVVSALLGVFLTAREYRAGLQRVVEHTSALAMSRPDLQLHLYHQDTGALENSLGSFTTEPAVVAAVIYDSQDARLALRGTGGDRITPTMPSLARVRASLGVAESGLTSLQGADYASGDNFLSWLTSGDSLIHLTLPLLSSVNPAQRGLTPGDFLNALATPPNKSRVVIGYLHAAIDRGSLLRTSMESIIGPLMALVGLFALCAGAAHLMLRHITKPLTQLNSLARRVSEGETGAGVDLAAGHELEPVARALNAAQKGLNLKREEVGLENKLLHMTAEERAAKLSLRDEELTRANAEIDAARQQLHLLANYDPLTSLPNRQLFTEQLALLLRLSARNARPLAVLFLNLDKFARINESLGRAAGDTLLQLTGKRLDSCLRGSDTLAHYVDSTTDASNISRLGGDEFAMVLSNLDRVDSAGPVAQRILDKLAEPMAIEGHDVVISASIGIAAAPRDGDNVDALLAAAGTAMNRAKSRKTRIEFYQKAVENEQKASDLRLEFELRKAIDAGELSLRYQPQVDTATGSITSAKALLRWPHPELGDVPPARLIAIAEQVGLIEQLGDWVLGKACEQFLELQSQGIELPRMALNVSSRQLTEEFANKLSAMISDAGITPGAIALCLSESSFLDNDQGTIGVLRQLGDMGVHLSLENFGTSYTPLGYLTRLPFSDIKIDRSFISGCDRREATAKLVQAIIAMAASLDLPAVAGGVETAGEYRFLAANGVRIMSGFLFSKPIPAEELRQQLAVPWHYMRQIQQLTLASELSASS